MNWFFQNLLQRTNIANKDRKITNIEISVIDTLINYCNLTKNNNEIR